jgi:hypothetical protein
MSVITVDAGPTNRTFQFLIFCYCPEREIKSFIAPKAMNGLFEDLAGVYVPCHRNHPLSPL